MRTKQPPATMLACACFMVLQSDGSCKGNSFLQLHLQNRTLARILLLDDLHIHRLKILERAADFRLYFTARSACIESTRTDGSCASTHSVVGLMKSHSINPREITRSSIKSGRTESMRTQVVILASCAI